MSMNLAPCEYKTGKKLGEGSYSVVREAIHIKTGERFAVKIISKSLMKGREEMLLNEINILKQVSKGHAHIITLHDFFETPNNLYLVIDLCKGGELFDRICEKGYYYEQDAAAIIQIVLDAVAYLHERNIVHRDIKPENILFKRKETLDDLVIADFGLSKIAESGGGFQALMTRCGTPGYMAPEIVKNQGYGKPVDLWAVGVMTYFLLCGYTPFDAQNPAEEVNNVLSGRVVFEPDEYWKDISSDAKLFIRKMLQVDPTKRGTAKDALRHPWILKYTTEQPTPTAVNLLPNVKEKFDARRRLKQVIGAVTAISKMQALTNPAHKVVDDAPEGDQFMVIKK